MHGTATRFLGRLALAASFASSALLFAPGASAAQDAPPLPPEYRDEVPEIPKEVPKVGWYGHHVLIPTLAFDALTYVALPVMFEVDTQVGAGLLLASVIGRSFSGPIAHLAHGRGAEALLSFGLETSGVVVSIATAAITLQVCDDLRTGYVGARLGRCTRDTGIGVMIGVPLAAAITGTVIDSVFLANRRPERAPKKAAMPFAVAPYALPSFQQDERTGGQRLGMQFGFAGQF